MSIAEKFYKILDTKGKIKQAISNIGITIEDDTVFEEYPNKILEVNDGKELVASAITEKGVETLATDTFSTMAENILNIKGGSSEGYNYGGLILDNPLSYYFPDEEEEAVFIFSRINAEGTDFEYMFAFTTYGTLTSPAVYSYSSSGATAITSSAAANRRNLYSAEYNTVTHKLSNIKKDSSTSGSITLRGQRGHAYYTGLKSMYFNLFIGR